ncbi:YciI family protein [Paractinoplanes ferrugineus]|uniref:Transcription initiation protein n=1 Tax=Paractinoplanes ferrugineus TaxID=113564 RepID=A0A919J090_9ACTN|nr:YciI family protein [Actinoplanes ferrugineus]GIE12115.1 transcription initiation protein [Actinoplanes ferrugineus]
MKYMLMMFGDATDMMEVRSKEWVRDMIAFMQEFNARLMAAGEFVDAQGLDVPATAKTVSLADGQVVVSDGPFAESKEALAGYWLLDVKDEARAIELAGEVAVWAQRLELRKIGEAPEI